MFLPISFLLLTVLTYIHGNAFEFPNLGMLPTIAIRSFLDTKFYLSDTVSPRSIKWVEKFYPNMPVNHFGYGSNKTFSLRYLINQTMWKPGGPIIFGVGCENPITTQVYAFGFNWYAAQQLNGMVLFIEHRYFGKSLPFGSDSFTSLDKLRYLSSEQALADYAVVLDWLKQNISGAANSPVIGIGGSYCGLLAAAVRIKYPHLVTGSIAAAAPMTFDVPCNAYCRVVTQTYNISVPGCATKIKQVWSLIDGMNGTVLGRSNLSGIFHLCPRQLHSRYDVETLKNWLAASLRALAIFNYPPYPVAMGCKSIVGAASNMDLLAALYQTISLYQNSTTSPVSCYNISVQLPAYFNDSLLSPAWTFISCMELGKLGTKALCSDGITDMFYPRHVPLTLFTQFCQRMFWGAAPQPNFIVTNYGGLRLKWASNIIFTNGQFDPTHALSPTNPIPGWDNSMHIINVQGSAHGEEVQWPYNPPPPPVVAAKSQMLTIMAQWSAREDTRCAQVSETSTTTVTSASSNKTASKVPKSTPTSPTTTHKGSIGLTGKVETIGTLILGSLVFGKLSFLT